MNSKQNEPDEIGGNEMPMTIEPRPADPTVRPSALAAFLEALNGRRGDLDAWLECNNEAEVRAHVLALVNVEREACAKVCDDMATGEGDEEYAIGSGACADAIRSRSGAKEGVRRNEREGTLPARNTSNAARELRQGREA